MRNRGAALLLLVAAAACGSTDNGADVVDVAIAAPPSASFSASRPLPTSTSRHDPLRTGSLSTGIRECDVYLRKLAAIFSCKMPADPASVSATLVEIANNFRASAGTPAQTETAATCAMAAENIRPELFCR